MPISVKAKGTPESNKLGCKMRFAYVENSRSKSGDCHAAYEDAYCAPTASVEISVNTKRTIAIASDFLCRRASRYSQSRSPGVSQPSAMGGEICACRGSNSCESLMKDWMRPATQENMNQTCGTPNANVGKRGRDANSRSECLEFLAGLEAYGLARRNADFLSGAGIAADPGLARANVKHAEAAQLNALAFSERILHGFKYGLDGLLGLRPAHTGLGNHCIYNVQLNHSILLLLSGKLC